MQHVTFLTMKPPVLACHFVQLSFGFCACSLASPVSRLSELCWSSCSLPKDIALTSPSSCILLFSPCYASHSLASIISTHAEISSGSPLGSFACRHWFDLFLHSSWLLYIISVYWSLLFRSTISLPSFATFLIMHSLHNYLLSSLYCLPAPLACCVLIL